ncbi:MAG: ComF family protein [Clostridia bacterium]|nr:ComF family protein [Clostridia bacterium]
MYKTFAKIILNNKKICDILKTCGIIINVPIHKKRKKQRGYDQSELIAREIARNIKGLKYVKVLKKIKNNPKQSLQSKEKRMENVKNAYELTNKQIIHNKRIILFDDVYTSRCNNQ